MSDNQDPNANADEEPEARVIQTQPGGLDVAHARVQSEMARADSSDEDEDDDPNANAGNEEDADNPEDPDKENKDEDEEDPDLEKGDPDGGEEDEEPPEQEDKSKAAPEAPEAPEEDITKPGKYKAKFVDEDGNEFHVTDMDQLPDDFAPRSQKEFGKSIQSLGREQDQYHKDQSEYEAKKGEYDRNTVVDQTVQSWKNEIKELTEDGTLPKDAKERGDHIVGVYKFMQDENKKGRRFNSWTHANEIFTTRQERKKSAEASNKADDDKKKRGGKVMGGGGGGPKTTGTKPNVRKAAPMGTSLDQVHSRVVGSL